MSIQEPSQTKSQAVLNKMFEQEARQSHGQYTHIEPEADDIDDRSSNSGRSRPSDDDRELTVWDVYTGDRLSIWDDPPVKESVYGDVLVLSAVDDPENSLWIQSSLRCSLSEME